MNDKNEQPSDTTSRSPQEIADAAFAPDATQADYPEASTAKRLPPHKRIIHWTANLTKKQKLILIFFALVLIGAASVAAYTLTKNEPQPASQLQQVIKKTTVPSKLTGLPVKPEVNEQQVTGVMIENSLEARPQSGLREAGVVYEAIAEGGITRFLALFQDTKATSIGPVRSVRPYYLDWLVPFDGAIAHVGGSPEALAQIRSQNIKDLDQFSNPAPYERINTRIAPHNVYTSTQKLRALQKQKGLNKSTFTGYPHAFKEKPAAKITARKIDFAMSGVYFNVRYNYSKKQNAYLRSVGGAPHLDFATKKQLTPKVVVALVMDRGQNGVYSVYKTTGSGKLFVFQNGTVTKGTWKKPSRKAQFSLVNSKKQPIKLNPGQTWITVVAPGGVSFKP